MDVLKIIVSSVALVSVVSLVTRRARKADYASGKEIKLGCKCGNFSGRVKVPKNPKQIAGLNVVCYCKDCVLWGSQVVKHGSLTPDQGDEVLMVYKGSVEVDTPELVRCVHLYKHSLTHRYLTSCCGTAIAASVQGFPILGLSGAIVKDKEQLIERLLPRYNVRLQDRKTSEEAFKSNPNASSGLSISLLTNYISFAVKGLAEMGHPSPLPEDFSKEELIFPSNIN